jgi:hypothetical protein
VSVFHVGPLSVRGSLTCSIIFTVSFLNFVEIYGLGDQGVNGKTVIKMRDFRFSRRRV